MQNDDRVSKGIADILEAKADMERIRRLADLRNSLVHRYWMINDGELFDHCSANLSDFSDFSSQVGKE